MVRNVGSVKIMKLGEWILDQAKKCNITGKKTDIIEFAKTIQKNHFTDADMDKAEKLIKEGS